MLTPENVYPIIAGVIAAVLLSILVFGCRKRDRETGRRLLILDILVAAHTIEWILIVFVQLLGQWAFSGANEANLFTWPRAVVWLAQWTR